MNVGVIYYRYPLYPQGSYFQEFLNKLSESLGNIYLIAAHHPKGHFKKSENIKTFWVPLFHIRFVEEAFFMIAVFIKVVFTRQLRQLDLVNSIGPRGLLAGWYLKKRYRIPLICTIEMLNERGSSIDNIHYAIVRLLLTRIPIDKFICWSSYYWDSHLKQWGIAEGKVVIIPSGIDISAYHPSIDGSEIKKKYAPSNPLIVFAKPLYSVNTQAAKLLVQSIALLKSKVKIILLVGGGEGQKEIQDLAYDLEIPHQVSFMPPTPFPEIPAYIAAADLIVLPFTYAPTTARSLLEAMAMGKPIITTSVGEAGNILEDKLNTLFVKLDSESMAKAINKLLNNRELSGRIGANARALVEEKFSLSTVTNQTIKCYRTLRTSTT